MIFDIKNDQWGLRSRTANGMWGQEEEKGNKLGVSSTVKVSMSNAAISRVFWTPVMEEQLVELWQEHEYLFNILCKKYQNRLAKTNAFVESFLNYCFLNKHLEIRIVWHWSFQN